MVFGKPEHDSAEPTNLFGRVKGAQSFQVVLNEAISVFALLFHNYPLVTVSQVHSTLQLDRFALE